ncbi:uroporphyrinogen-III C-methyltransferase [Alteromonas sp. KS69]|jgi:uroporphyrin-III C-methyltransferase/precorrin-2 dehydrogenase/sirohydrochlorin ferrochelatase|uniref:siroheme synthase CysG n=1 Tax=Alteromonas sp. KS69 TaxID=2109917 RepID=UPI000C5E4B9E|nr:siroheme synthase CysG [Alteromonas sp. KS69]MBB66041.1 uroporphyrinogen-III C-methyltransferase [Rickettsiales bacterium]RUP78775.1 uroporphyrinogen-III C-methyltransferase [Alteromonas sp. KS69]|tara:strand:- start:4818 stop:6203 length:1386 start_codon:yes stop_codon:yes gene_type:complete
MDYFPLFLDARSLRCLIVGAGEVAARKLELIMKTPAHITVVAPWACDTIKRLAQNEKVTLIEREFIDSDLADKDMVFIATDKSETNQAIHDLAREQKVLVNVVDNTPLCQFITPSIVDRSPIIIAMSSGGVAPVLLRYLRQKLETVLPANLSKLGAFSEKFREKVKQTLNGVTARRYFWEDVLDGDIAEMVEKGQDSKADAAFETALTAAAENNQVQGQVYLVGAGPGDPDLLTFRALRLMQKADVVVYDRLVSPQILELVRRDAEKIYVGKAKSNHSLPQDDINQLMVDEAKKGNRVVRLKGGDPFIFGRGGEEIQTLIQHGIEFQVVPGITAANGASSYAGIPLTHRDHAQSVVFATGHLKDDTIDLNWQSLAHANQTIVFYMGLTGLPIICKKLIENGLTADTPIALIQSATTENQVVVTGTLSDITQNPATSALKPPTLIIVGTVVSLHNQLNWFGD